MHWTFFRSRTKRFVRKKKTNKQTNKLRRRRWQSKGCVKLKQQVSNPAQIASHSLHLRLLLLFLLLSSFSPSSLSSFHGDCCGFSPSLCLGWFWILFFLFYVSNGIGSCDLTWKNLEPLLHVPWHWKQENFWFLKLAKCFNH